MPADQRSIQQFRDAARAAGYSDDEINQEISRVAQPQQPAAPTATAAPAQSATPAFAHALGVIGTNLVAPFGSRMEGGLIPTDKDIRAWGAQPSGIVENALAAGATAAAPMLAAGPTAAAPLLASTIATPIRAAAPAASAFLSGAAGEARREIFDKMSPGIGALVDAGVGGLLGGAAGLASGLSSSAPTMATVARGAAGTAAGITIGEGAEALARHVLGFPPWLAQAISIPIGAIAGGGTAGAKAMKAAVPGGLIGAYSDALTPTPQNQINPLAFP